MEAKLAADRELVEGNGKRGLEWTIIRPGSLTDDEASGHVDAGRVHLGVPVSRADVASVVLECLREEGTKGLAFDVLGAVEGGGEGVKEAVGGVARERIDCFQGFY